MRGFRHGKNNGPDTDEEHTSEIDGDMIRLLATNTDLGLFPHNMAATSPVIVGDMLYVNTSSGVDESHINISSPPSPGFIALNRPTGEIVWEDRLPGNNILLGQWSSRAYGEIGGSAGRVRGRRRKAASNISPILLESA